MKILYRIGSWTALCLKLYVAQKVATGQLRYHFDRHVFNPADPQNIIFLSGYKAPEVSEWNKYKDDLKRKRKRKLQGTYTDLTATAPAFVEGLDEVGAKADAGIDRSKLSLEIDRSKLSLDVERSKLSIDIERSKLSVDVDVDSDVPMRSRHCLSASNSNSSFSSTSTTPFCRDGQRPPPPRLAPPANAARRRISAAGSADIEEVGSVPVTFWPS